MPSIDLPIATADVLSRLLRRLPPSLWDTDPTSETVQRDLCAAIGREAAIWLENRAIAQTMTRLLEAEGVDLDTLLADYGLKRYCQRPDDYARQIGMQILWTPKGTDYAVATLADLLLEDPHQTLRTGQSHTHVFVPLTHPVTVPSSYWGLIAADSGVWYGVTVDGETPTITTAPVGLDLAPGPHTLTWFTVLDEVSTVWYVTIRGDTLHVSQTQPAGYGSVEPFSVLDGQGRRWMLTVQASLEALVATPDVGLTTFGYWRLTPTQAEPPPAMGPPPAALEYWQIVDTTPAPPVVLPAFDYWRLRDTLSNAVVDLFIEAEVPTLGTPAGGTDQTPGGSPLDWVQIADDTGATWYLQVTGDALAVGPSLPSGTGASGPLDLHDTANMLWHVTVQRSLDAVMVDTATPIITPPTFTYWRLRDQVSTASLVLFIEAEVPMLDGTPPPAATDQTPGAVTLDWIALLDDQGATWYLQAAAYALALTQTLPSGSGASGPLDLLDAASTTWHVRVQQATEAVVVFTGAVQPTLARGDASVPDAGGGGGVSPAPLAAPQVTPQAAGDTLALWIEAQVPMLSPTAPTGTNQTPGGTPLDFVQVSDNLGATWYLQAQSDALVATQTLPAGHGTAVALTLQDGTGTQWQVAMESGPEAMVTTAVSLREARTALVAPSPQTITPLALWIEADVPTLGPPPAGGTDQTPGGAALDWVIAVDETSTLWYVSVDADTLLTSRTQPGGSGSLVPVDLLDQAGTLWRLTTASGPEAVVTTVLHPPQADLVVLAPTHAYEAVRLLDTTGTSWWLAIQAGVPVFLPSLPLGAQDVTPSGGPYHWLRLFAVDGTSRYLAPATTGALLVTTTPPSGLGTPTPQALGDAGGVVWQLGITAGGLVGTSNAPAVDYGGLATTLCLHDGAGQRWFWRVRHGRLAWSRWLWPDTVDQSPWGNLGWLQMTTTTSVAVFVFPTLRGGPTAASAPPLQSSWGWSQPVSLVDTAGTSWHLVVSPAPLGAPAYAQMRDDTGTVQYLWIEAEVPTLTSSPPAGGLDQTPDGVPFDTFAVVDELGRQVWVTLEHDTLVSSLLRGTGVGTDAFVNAQDTLGRIWHLDAPQGTEALRTSLASEQWVVTVAADPPPTIAPPRDPLSLRDAVEAIAHVQAAGSLVTVLIK